MALDPWLIVADEPVSSLDASVRGEILALMLRLVREKGPVALEGLKLVTLEGLDRLAGRKPA